MTDTVDPKTPKNFRDYIELISPPWLLEEMGRGFVGIVLGYMANTLSEGMSLAIKMPWLKEPTSPQDALPLVTAERRLPRYPVENSTQHRNRLHGAWDAYQFGGDEDSILGQLALAGFPGVQIFDPSVLAMVPADYWSHFIVYFPLGTHPVTAVGPPWGSFNWGDGTLYGPVGITLEMAATFRGIIEKFKPFDWICRNIIFQISGWVYGGGSTWGQADLLWGGNIAEMGP